MGMPIIYIRNMDLVKKNHKAVIGCGVTTLCMKKIVQILKVISLIAEKIMLILHLVGFIAMMEL
ncbi:hypothetical protein PROVRETT_05520 [Providencia rettgeri DSM 1131]|nr:hypothetical protein PROVRETT_05520 [Providencia rettgeri DSM 1131]